MATAWSAAAAAAALPRQTLRLFLALLLLVSCNAESKVAPFDEAESLTHDLTRARELYRQVATKDADAVQRDRAAIRAARIDWYVFHDAASARTWLGRVGPASSRRAAASVETARMELELTRDFNAARAAAARALAEAKTRSDADDAHVLHAAAAIEEARVSRRCPAPALNTAVAEVRAVIDEAGPTVDTSLLLLGGALMAGDDANALQAWRWYYADTPGAVPPSIPARRELGLALAKARLYELAELVLADPCAPIPPDAATQELTTYAASLRHLRAIAAEQHRAIARGVNDDGAAKKKVQAETEALWNALPWTGARPKFSLPAARKELDRRFGTVANLSDVDGAMNIILGHRIVDEQRQVEQYGRRAPTRFVQLDGMVATGYLAWVTRGSTGTGGWSGDDGIVQIRPMYADGPIHRWRRIADPELRAQREQEIADETRRDDERAKDGALAYFAGLDMRLQQQYAERLRDSLAAQGLRGDALRDAFIARVREEEFAYSIWAHEGRHAIDQKLLGIDDDKELEFRAKLSQVTFAPAPRAALSAILSQLGGGGAHATANERVLRGVEQWMRAHAAAIAGLEAAKPLLPQMDRLTDEQLREAFRSQDPLAR